MAQLKKPTIKNPDLVAAMADFKQNQNPQTEEAMIQAIQQASFIAPIALQKPLSEVAPDEEGRRQVQASLMAVTNNTGTKLFPAFTDWLEFLKWKNDPDADTMVISYDQYCDILLKQSMDISGIVINPAESNVVMRKEKMAELKGVELPKAPAGGAGNITPMMGTERLTNPNVIAAAVQMRETPTPEIRNQLFNALRQGRFVAPAIIRDMPKEVKAGERVNAKAEFIMIHHGDQKFLPIFTSLSELQKWTAAPKCSALPMTFAQYTGMLSAPQNTAAGIVIDPFTLGLSFTKEQVMAVQPKLELQDLKVIPMDMLQELRAHMEVIPEIRRAYLAGVRANNTDGYLILIEPDTPGSDIRGLADPIAQIVKRHGSCVVAPTESPLGKQAIEGKSPFYEA